MARASLLVLGLMSGTSADGIDCALVRLPERPRLRDARQATHHHVAFSAAQRREIFALFDTASASAELVCRMNFQLGEWFAAAATEAMRVAGIGREDLDVIGSHGQTIFHCPPGSAGASQAAAPEVAGAEVACTLQIGEPAVIAERTGVTTVADFRVRDVAAGGHGAPLVSFVDVALFRQPRRTRVVLNLGGIANVTVIPPSARGDASPIAFDTGPGNMVMDWLAQHTSGGRMDYDDEGRLAASGQVDEELLAALLDDPYFRALPPKTTGRERYGAAYAQRLAAAAAQGGLSAADLLATAAALTARTVAGAIREATRPLQAPVEVIAGGGGTRNPTLMAAIARHLAGARVMAHEAFGVSSQAKEALSFAILAAAAVRGQPNAVPSCTGASQATVMGKILPGQNYHRLMRRLYGRRDAG